MTEDRHTKGGNEPIDIQKLRLVKELREELGGLFGINDRDIEDAIQRLFEGRIRSEADSGERLPALLREAIRLLDSLEALVEKAYVEDQGETGEQIVELAEHYIGKIRSKSADRIDPQ